MIQLFKFFTELDQFKVNSLGSLNYFEQSKKKKKQNKRILWCGMKNDSNDNEWKRSQKITLGLYG